MHGLLLIKGSRPTLLHTAVLNLQGRGAPCSNGCPLTGCMRWEGSGQTLLACDGVRGGAGAQGCPCACCLKDLATEVPAIFPGEQQYSGKPVLLQRSSPWPAGKSWGWAWSWGESGQGAAVSWWVKGP